MDRVAAAKERIAAMKAGPLYMCKDRVNDPRDGRLRKARCPDTSIACKSSFGGYSSSGLRPMTFEAMANGMRGCRVGHAVITRRCYLVVDDSKSR
jgi:hypothetical protein